MSNVRFFIVLIVLIVIFAIASLAYAQDTESTANHDYDDLIVTILENATEYGYTAEFTVEPSVAYSESFTLFEDGSYRYREFSGCVNSLRYGCELSGDVLQYDINQCFKIESSHNDALGIHQDGYNCEILESYIDGTITDVTYPLTIVSVSDIQINIYVDINPTSVFIPLVVK